MLTKRMQVQTIADFLAGQGNGFRPEDLDEPWRGIYEAIKNAEPDQKRQALIQAVDGRKDADTIMGAILAPRPGTRPEFQSLYDLAPTLPPIEWLWDGWIPKGMLSLLGGQPGAGKSFVGLDLARRIIAGDEFPDGSPVTDPGANIIYADAEMVPQLINARAEAWEMDCRQLYLMENQNGQMIDLALPAWQDQLIEMVYALKPALVVIDSLSSVNTKGENNIEDIRGILNFLSGLAVGYKCGLLLIHHLRKRGALDRDSALSIDDFRGSSHIVAMARSVLGLSLVQVGPDEDKNGPRRLEVVKTNLARYPDPLGMHLVPLHPTGVLLDYGEAPTPYHEPTKLDMCVEWLTQVLKDADEPMKPKDVVELGDSEGHSRRVIYRARNVLGTKVLNTEHKGSPNNAWMWDDDCDGKAPGLLL